MAEFDVEVRRYPHAESARILDWMLLAWHHGGHELFEREPHVGWVLAEPGSVPLDAVKAMRSALGVEPTLFDREVA